MGDVTIWQAIRCALITLLAGNDAVIINTHIDRDGRATLRDKRGVYFLNGCSVWGGISS